MEGFIEKLDFLRSKVLYIGLIVSTIVLGYIAVTLISGLPKPETIPEFIKFYFKSPESYLETTGVVLFAFASAGMLGVATIIQGILLEYCHIAIRIVIVIVGAGIIALSIYFFNYFLLLIISILLVGVLGMIVLSGNDNRRY